MIDEKDWKILERLEKNGRESIQTLSIETGMPPSTIHNRIKKMESSGVIEEYSVKLNEKIMGRDFTVYMLINGSTGNYLGENFLEKKEVAEVVGITGEYDLLIKMQFANIQDYNKFLTDFRQQYTEHVKQTVTMVRTERIK
jgi:Lrp/AsnC family leucine-responsive transcriptional regulator